MMPKIAQDHADLYLDAARYRYIRDNLAQMHSPQMDGEHGWRIRNIGGWWRLTGPTLDAAIDRMIKKLEEQAERTYTELRDISREG
jgi:hypothetical protein